MSFDDKCYDGDQVSSVQVVTSSVQIYCWLLLRYQQVDVTPVQMTGEYFICNTVHICTGAIAVIMNNMRFNTSFNGNIEFFTISSI